MKRFSCKRLKGRFSWMLGLSALFHLTLFLYLTRPLFQGEEEVKRSIKSVTFQSLSSKQLAALKQKMLIKEKMKEAINRQVVNNSLTGEEKTPVDSRFLGEKNQTYEQQTIAKNVDSFNQGGKGEKKDSVKAKKKEAKQEKKELKIEDLQFHNFTQLEGRSLKNKKMEQEKEEKEKVAQESGSDKEAGDQGSGVGLSSNNDYITDVPLGDATNLNTTEFKFWGFYNRIRQQLEQYWGATLRQKAQQMWQKGRKLQNDQDYITRLSIILDAKGNIVKINIVDRSGAHELDQAAIESFNKAGPFPNPPKEMLKDGVTVIEWGFVVRS